MATRGAIASVERLPAQRAEEVVAVLADSFAEYPVMRHIIGHANGDYDSHLVKLMRFFVAARISRNEPVLAVSDSERAIAAAILTSPFQPEAPPSLVKHREALWEDLGPAARTRYEALGEVWGQVSVPDRHYHINMIGVAKSYAGSGLGRLLLDAIHDMSLDDLNSTGVTLNTEDENNVSLYEHFGYEVIGHYRVTDDLETWVMFRPDEV